MSPVSEDSIRKVLHRILASHEFRASKRSQDFLRYVVDHALTGQSDRLKERTIGIEVFGRSTDYDPSDDATVRVKAGEVRKRLGLYYASEGAHDPIRIELPAGTYVPEFRVVETNGAGDHGASAPAGEGAATILVTDAIVPSAGPGGHGAARRRFAMGAAVLVALATAGIIWLKLRPSQSALDQFWSPVVDGTTPVSLCAAYVPVWAFDDVRLKRPPATVADFTYLSDQYVGGGDLIAVSRIASMLTRMNRSFLVRVGAAVSFQDLRSTPAVLVGYSYTQWKEISSQMRYFIDASKRPVMITDNGVPTSWFLPNLSADRHTNEDYAIVSRVFHPDTHAMLVELSGITQYGTDAAGELLTKTDMLSEALHGAPSDWQRKNLQLVLRVKVISGVPATPQVVASHFW